MAKKSTSIRPSWEFSDELIVSLSRRLGIEELTSWRFEEVQKLPPEEQKAIKAKLREMVFGALTMIAENTSAPIPTNAVVLDTENKFPFWSDLAKRTEAGKNEVRPPAEVLAERFRTKVGEVVWMTEAELAEEALRVYHERGIKSKNMKEVVSEAIAARCQSVVSKFLQSKYGSPSSRKSVDYSHFELALALLKNSLDNFENGDGQGSQLNWIVDGEQSVYDVPAWKVDDEGNGYRNQYPAITPSYIIKACMASPINKMVNLTKVNEWIRDNNIQGITSKIKGNKGG